MHGKHRKPSRLKITLHATGGTIAGAAVVGVVATTAQAAIIHAPGDLPVGPPMAGSSAAAAVTAAPKPAAPEAASDAKAQPKKAPQPAPPRAALPKAPFAPKAAAPAPKQIKAADIIKLAKSQVGIAENGGGETKFQDWYMSTNRAKETVKRDGGSLQGYEAAAWCSMFISWLGDRLGFTDQMGADAWTIAHAGWFQQQGRWGSNPLPGAVAFFDWGGGKTLEGIDHVGLVVKDNGNGTIQTIEGNTSNAVKVRERSIRNSVVGFGYPDYAK